MRFIIQGFFGFLITVGCLLPTRCGAMLAIGLGIYEGALYVLSFRGRRQKMKLRVSLLPLILGAVTALLVLHWARPALAGAELPAKFFTVGLICGALPSVIRRMAMRRCGTSWVWTLPASFALLMLFSIFANLDVAFLSMLPDALRMLVGGVALGASMLLPGVAGMECLTMLSTPASILDGGDMGALGVVMLSIGCAAGVLAGARLLSLMFERCPTAADGVILGLMTCSLILLINSSRFMLNMQGAIAIALLLVGATLTLLMEKLRDFFLNRSGRPGETVADF